MSTQTAPQMPTSIRQTLARSSEILALGLLCIVAVLVAYRFTSVRAAPARAMDRGQVSLIESAQQSVLNYLRVHSVVQPLPTSAASLDAAQQSVIAYLRTHESVKRSVTPWDPAVQAVLDYLRVHSR
jgi:hypothetical protein